MDSGTSALASNFYCIEIQYLLTKDDFGNTPEDLVCFLD